MGWTFGVDRVSGLVAFLAITDINIQFANEFLQSCFYGLSIIFLLVQTFKKKKSKNDKFQSK